MRHHLTTQGIELDPEGGARAWSYFLVVSEVGPDHAGRYIDRLRRVDGRWQIEHRRVVVEWQSPDTVYPVLQSAPESGTIMIAAIRVEKLGGPEVLTPALVSAELPGAGQVTVEVAACGVNFIDVYFRTGLYPRPLPFVPGLEGAGRIIHVGQDVGDLAVGDRVAWSTAPGSYASRLNAAAPSLVRVPDGVDDDVAAAVMLQGMTSHYLVHGVRTTQLGDTALVHAAAGGVGLLLIQMLTAAGARVIGTCSSEEKAALARAAGAEEIVRYDRDDFAQRVREWTRGRGVDVVYDSVGKTTFEGSLASLRPRGLLCLFGQSSGVVAPFDLGTPQRPGLPLRDSPLARPLHGHARGARAAGRGRARGGCIRRPGRADWRPLRSGRRRRGASGAGGPAHDRQGAADPLIRG